MRAYRERVRCSGPGKRQRHWMRSQLVDLASPIDEEVGSFGWIKVTYRQSEPCEQSAQARGAPQSSCQWQARVLEKGAAGVRRMTCSGKYGARTSDSAAHSHFTTAIAWRQRVAVSAVTQRSGPSVACARGITPPLTSTEDYKRYAFYLNFIALVACKGTS